MARSLTLHLLSYVIAFGAMVYLAYALPLWLPGDFTTAMYAGSDVSLSASQAAQAQALLTPTQVNFGQYVMALVRGEFGDSLAYAKPVTTLIQGALPWTLFLGLSAYGAAFVLAFVLGVESAFGRGSSKDRSLSAVLVSLDGVPELVLGVGLLLVFGVQLAWFPMHGAHSAYSDAVGVAYVKDVLYHWTLPALTLFLSALPGQFLLVRVSVLGALPQAFVHHAKTRGLPAFKIRYKYVALNALMPILTRMGFRLTGLVTSLIVVEIIFAYPGIGSLLLDAIALRDFPVVQVILLGLAFFVIGMSMVLDGVAFILTPKAERKEQW
jgi:peptide/nickel transport system permease protein